MAATSELPRDRPRTWTHQTASPTESLTSPTSGAVGVVSPSFPPRDRAGVSLAGSRPRFPEPWRPSALAPLPRFAEAALPDRRPCFAGGGPEAESDPRAGGGLGGVGSGG